MDTAEKVAVFNPRSSSENPRETQAESPRMTVPPRISGTKPVTSQISGESAELLRERNIQEVLPQWKFVAIAPGAK